MAVAASYIAVDRQIGIEDLQLAESFDCVKGIKTSRFCRDQGLRLEPRFFGAYAGKYTVEGNKVTHHVEASWRPDWIGPE